jgi:hypothetical protein
MEAENNDFIIDEMEQEESSTSYGMKSSSLLKPKEKEKEKKSKNPENMWMCRICFDDLEEPVVTLCGHIYCWTCIYTWYTTKKPSTVYYYDILRAGYIKAEYIGKKAKYIKKREYIKKKKENILFIMDNTKYYLVCNNKTQEMRNSLVQCVMQNYIFRN